jgi:hypothetical protein
MIPVVVEVRWGQMGPRSGELGEGMATIQSMVERIAVLLRWRLSDIAEDLKTSGIVSSDSEISRILCSV